ncbi:ABC transporter ATP-binding protein/permease [Methylocapsa acidiphila]|uniref:ABC transporter ATP-binding protein/permease n=1 Tax=Methylocapsa acidiphila TaxID=133552 RepID=UPI0003FC6FC2|nr:ABC transporter ATP-binding protein/permease [Methylocapsa acidiphila]
MEQAIEVSESVAKWPAPVEELAHQIRIMGKAFMASANRNALVALGVALCVVVGATAYGQIKLNAWNGPFYDSLSHKNFASFLYQLVVFAGIAGGLLILNVAQTWLNQTTKMKLREGLTADLVDQWLEPNRAFRLAGSGEIGVNPDQRIHEDVRHLTELSTDLGIGLLQATLLLASFIGVLWILSRGIILNIDGLHFAIPGYMVWCALLYAGTASWLSWLVGRPLVRLNAERYAREADLRVALVRVNEHANGIAIHAGESDEKAHLHGELDKVVAMMRRLVSAATRLAWVTAGYGWFAIIAPFIVASPGFFSGDLSLGGLMVAVGAFNQVQQALRWFIDNFSTIADWRATLLRVASFRQALVEMDKLGHKTGQIERLEASDGKLTFDNLGVAAPAGCTALSETHISIAPGERVLIVGAPKVGKTNLFRAIAGLWPWGCGRILLPPRESMFFMSQPPYIPPGSLREVLSFPSPAAAFTDRDLTGALDRMKLSHLAPELDRVAAWENDLSPDELQNIAFSRLLLHKPSWVLIDDAIGRLDAASRAIVIDIFQRELASATVVSIGRQDAPDGFYTRVLHLRKDPEGLRLSPCARSQVHVRPIEQKAA